MSNRPRAPSAGWSLFPPLETTRVPPSHQQVLRSTSTHRTQTRPGHPGSGSTTTRSLSHDTRHQAQLPTTSVTPPTSWKTPAPAPASARITATGRSYTRPVSAEPPACPDGLRRRGQSLTARSGSAQSYYHDTRHHPTRSASRNGRRPASRTSSRDQPVAVPPQLRRKPLPELNLRPRPSSPTLNQRYFNPGTPRPAPTPPNKSSPVSQTGSVRTSMSVDAAGNPRSFWDLESERGDAGSDDEKLDLVRKVRSWSLAKRSSGAMDEKSGAQWHRDASMRAERAPVGRSRASKRQSSGGWRQRMLCSC